MHNIKIIISLLGLKLKMHNMDITILIVLLWFNLLYYSNLFKYFLSLSSLLKLKIPIFCILVFVFCCCKEPPILHQKEVYVQYCNGATCPYYIYIYIYQLLSKNEASIMFLYQLCFSTELFEKH